MTSAFRNWRLFLGSLKPLQRVGLVFIGVATIVLWILSFVVDDIGWLEVFWSSLSVYGLFFDVLNLIDVTKDREVAAPTGFNVMYWDSLFAASVKRVITLTSSLILGVYSMTLPPPPPVAIATFYAWFFGTLFFIMIYCIASNAQDAWLTHQKLDEFMASEVAKGRTEDDEEEEPA